MKKTILSIAVIAAAIFAASCQKENLQENTASEGSASVFTATIETVAGTKTTVERVTSPSVAYKTKWDNGDEIGINGTIFTATPASDATKATFTKKNTGDTEPSVTFKAYFPEKLCIFNIKGILLSLPATYTYADGKYNMPMYAESTTTSLSFKNLCGVLAITVSGADFTSVSSIEVSSDQQMNGNFTADADGVLSFTSTTLTDELKKVTLDFEPAKTIASDGSATFYIPVPPATNHTLTIKVTGGSTTKIMVTKKSGGVTVARNKVYPIDFEDNSDALLGVFTVANDGAGNVKKVRFSPGNLYYDGSAFKFEDKQYSNTTEWNTSHVSNFYWSQTASSAYADYYDESGTTTTDVLFTNATETTPKADFTVSGMKGLWRTLSQTEWKYLLETRTMTNGKNRYSNAMSGVTIDSKTYTGIFLYPDNYNGDIVSGLMTWEQINAAGIVFLPSTGYRTGSSIKEVSLSSTENISCIYWTSTAEPDEEDNAYRMFFQWNGSKLSTDFEHDGERGWAVGIRLVSDVK